MEDGEALRAIIKIGDWNQFQVIARGNTLIHLLNGHVTAIFVDDDQANRSMKGLIGVQLHTGAADEGRVPEHLSEEPQVGGVPRS